MSANPTASKKDDHIASDLPRPPQADGRGQSPSGEVVGPTVGLRVVDLLTSGDRGWGIAMSAASLLGAWLLAVGTGEPTAVSRHWFYVPVVLAAVRLGPLWAAVAGVVAGLLAGPLVPLPEVGIGLYGHGQWVVRTGFFVAIGVLVAVLTGSVRRYQRQQVALAERARRVGARERDLAVQRAAVIQTVSHELRTPLTVIKGTVATWARLEDEITPAAAARLIPPMQRATQRLESLVSTVLAAADAQRADELQPVQIETSQLLAVAVRRIHDPDARSRVETIDHGKPRVTTVPDYVVTALGLLVDNALKFSPPHEQVTVVARTPNGTLELEVRDRGPGIDPDHVERLFEPFTQADQTNTRSHPGLGIGLHTARKLVDRLGGEIELAARPDGGTVARITVPGSN